MYMKNAYANRTDTRIYIFFYRSVSAITEAPFDRSASFAADETRVLRSFVDDLVARTMTMVVLQRVPFLVDGETFLFPNGRLCTFLHPLCQWWLARRHCRGRSSPYSHSISSISNFFFLLARCIVSKLTRIVRNGSTELCSTLASHHCPLFLTHQLVPAAQSMDRSPRA